MRRLALTVLAIVGLLLTRTAWAADTDNWTVYLHDNSRDNAVQDGRTFAAGPVHLAEMWSLMTGGAIAGSPVIEGGFAYVPSWDGNLYALNLATRGLAWKHFLGTQTNWTGSGGVASPPTFAADIGSHGAILIGGGGAERASDENLYFCALDAQTGDVLWKTRVGSAKDDAIFDSPLYLNGRVYIGLAGSGAGVMTDAPPRAGILFELDGKTGAVLHSQSMAVPKGLGGAIWGSVSTDATGDRIFVATGDGSNPKQRLTEALVAVDPGTLKVLDHWQAPASVRQISDNDFGTSVTVFPAGGRTLIGATLKSGHFYALDAAHLSKGRAWMRRIGDTGTGDHIDDVFSSAFASGTAYPGGQTLYSAGPNVRIKGKTYPSGLFALNPANGHLMWSVPLDGVTPYGAVTVYDDALIIPVESPVQGDQSGSIEVRSASDGHLLASLPTAGTPLAAPVVVDGTIYIGTQDGLFHVITLTG